MRGPGAGCEPWGMPELAITAPTLLLVALYVLFATTATYFSLGQCCRLLRRDLGAVRRNLGDA